MVFIKLSSVEYFDGSASRIIYLGLGPVFDLMAGPVFDFIAGPVFDFIAGPVLDLMAGPDFDVIPDLDVSGLDMTNGFKVSFTILVKNSRQTKNESANQCINDFSLPP